MKTKRNTDDLVKEGLRYLEDLEENAKPLRHRCSNVTNKQKASHSNI